MTQQQHPRRRAARLEPDARRASILDAATALFAERGLSFTTGELASAAGVSEATVFRYFPDKAALMDATRNAVLDLGTLTPLVEVAQGLPTLIQRVAAVAHALSPGIERTAQLLQSADTKEHPPTDSIGALIDALAPIFDDEVVTDVPREQLAGFFLGAMLINTALATKAGAERIATDRLVDLVLHGIAERKPTERRRPT